MNHDRPVDTWGPYRAAIEDHLASCADYLDRLQRSLAGEIVPTATTSVPRPTSSSWSPGAWCDAPRTSKDGSTPATPRSCATNPAPPTSRPASCPVDTAASTTTTRPARPRSRPVTLPAISATWPPRPATTWASLTPVVDRAQTAGDNHLTPDDRESLYDLSTTLERISHDARRLAACVGQLEVGGPGHHSLSAPPVTDQQAGGSWCDPGVGL